MVNGMDVQLTTAELKRPLRDGEGARAKNCRFVSQEVVNSNLSSQQEVRLASRDGMQIASGRWPSDVPMCSVVQIAPGMGEHCGRASWWWPAATRRWLHG